MSDADRNTMGERLLAQALELWLNPEQRIEIGPLNRSSLEPIGRGTM